MAEAFGFRLSVDVCGIPTSAGKSIRKADRSRLLLEGRYQIVSGLHREPYLARGRGDKRLVYIAQTQNDWDDRVIVEPQVDSAKALEGRAVVVTSGAPCVVGNLRHALRAAGADPDRIELVEDLNGDGRDAGLRGLGAVESGAAAGAVVDLPFDRIGERMGLRALDLPAVPVIHNVTICVNRLWAESHRDLVIDVLRSLISTIHYFKTKPEAVQRMLSEGLGPLIGVRDTQDIEYLQTAWANLLEQKPYPHPLAIWNAFQLDLGVGTQGVTPLEAWDTSFVKSIDDSGFIDQLWATTAVAG
jgi:ABC-type nitrate/sulfonate/bicarbonate transport system substrate-binding protein